MAKSSLAKCICASRLLYAQMLTKIELVFLVITWISLIVLYVSVEPRTGEA